MPNLKKEEIKPYQATIKECEKCGYQKSPSTQFEDMPNPEQNKWDLKTEINTRLWYALGDIEPTDEKMKRAVESIYDLISKLNAPKT